MIYSECEVSDTRELLSKNHYLSSARTGKFAFAQYNDSAEMVACQIWKHPSSRNLPSDGTWIELCRWCLTPQAGKNAGSKMHGQSIKVMKDKYPDITTLVSYSDPSQGHTGALYASCNWQWAPTWHRLRPPPTGNGTWGTGEVKTVKDRWVFPVKNDDRRNEILRVKDNAGQRKLDELIKLREKGIKL